MDVRAPETNILAHSQEPLIDQRPRSRQPARAQPMQPILNLRRLRFHAHLFAHGGRRYRIHNLLVVAIHLTLGAFGALLHQHHILDSRRLAFVALHTAHREVFRILRLLRRTQRRPLRMVHILQYLVQPHLELRQIHVHIEHRRHLLVAQQDVQLRQPRASHYPKQLIDRGHVRTQTLRALLVASLHLGGRLLAILQQCRHFGHATQLPQLLVLVVRTQRVDVRVRSLQTLVEELHLKVQMVHVVEVRKVLAIGTLEFLDRLADGAGLLEIDHLVDDLLVRASAAGLVVAHALPPCVLACLQVAQLAMVALGAQKGAQLVVGVQLADHVDHFGDVRPPVASVAVAHLVQLAAQCGATVERQRRPIDHIDEELFVRPQAVHHPLPQLMEARPIRQLVFDVRAQPCVDGNLLALLLASRFESIFEHLARSLRLAQIVVVLLVGGGHLAALEAGRVDAFQLAIDVLAETVNGVDATLDELLAVDVQLDGGQIVVGLDAGHASAGDGDAGAHIAAFALQLLQVFDLVVQLVVVDPWPSLVVGIVAVFALRAGQLLLAIAIDANLFVGGQLDWCRCANGGRRAGGYHCGVLWARRIRVGNVRATRMRGE